MKKITDKLLSKIIKWYEQGYTQKKIGDMIGCHKETVGKTLRKNGISGIGRKGRKHHFNEKFFDKWSPNMAYILGFLCADGNVFDTTVSFRLAKKDVEILRFMQKNIGNVPIEKDKDNGVRIRYNSVYMVKKLITKYGITPNKTFTLQLPIIPKKYTSDFVRGYFDGDGWVYIHPSGGISFGMCCASQAFMNQLYQIIGKIGKLRCRPYKNDPIRKPQYHIEGYETYAIPFRDFIYSTNGFSLKRKKKTFYIGKRTKKKIMKATRKKYPH